MSYTAQLFESLMRASAETPGRPHQFGVAPVDALVSNAGQQSAASPTESTKGSSEPLPHELDECYAVIRFQRTQIGQLRSRVSALEEQNAQYRDQSRSLELQAVNAASSKVTADELVALRSTVEAQTAEIVKQRHENAALARQVAEANARVESVRAAGERERQDLAYKLGRETALAAAANSIGASPAPGRQSSFLISEPPALSAPPELSAASPAADAAGSSAAAATDGTAAPAAAAASSTATMDTTTSSLLAKQEIIKQQEELLLALKQQQTANRVLSAQNQRQAHRLHATASGSSGPHSAVALLAAHRARDDLHAGPRPMRGAAAGYHGGPYGGGPQYPQHPGTYGGHSARDLLSPQRGPGRGRLAADPGFGSPPYGGDAYGAPPPPVPRGRSPHSSAYGSRYPPPAEAAPPGYPPYYGGPLPPPPPPPARGGPPGGARRRGRGAKPPPPTYDEPEEDEEPEDDDDDEEDDDAEEEDDYSASGTGSHRGSKRSGSVRGGSRGRGGGPPPVVGDGFPQMLPPPGSPVKLQETQYPPPGGWTVYLHPPPGHKWPDSMSFFRPLVETGIPVLKHGRMGRPHTRLMWLDISDADTPTLVWQEGDALDPDKLKPKDRLPLIDIIDIKAGQVSDVLKRSGKKEHADRYMTFSSEARSLDIEAPTPEGRDWMFQKFAALFQAYATAKMEKKRKDEVTLRVAEIMDAPPPAATGAAAGASPDRGGGRSPTRRGGGGDDRRRSRSPRGGVSPGGGRKRAGSADAGNYYGGGGRGRQGSPGGGGYGGGY